MAIFKRVKELRRQQITFLLDGEVATAMRGDTVLMAVLTKVDSLRKSEFSGERRAGFCLIGACQDCWMHSEDGRRIRACTTLIEPGMRLRTTPRQGKP